jgi:hypothetical protein
VPRVDRDRAGELAFEHCANVVRAPPLPITVRSPPAARSRTQHTERDLQPGTPPNGGGGRQAPRPRTDADTETAEHDDDDCSARLPGTAPASEGMNALEHDGQGAG